MRSVLSKGEYEQIPVLVSPGQFPIDANYFVREVAHIGGKSLHYFSLLNHRFEKVAVFRVADLSLLASVQEVVRVGDGTYTAK